MKNAMATAGVNYRITEPINGHVYMRKFRDDDEAMRELSESRDDALLDKIEKIINGKWHTLTCPNGSDVVWVETRWKAVA